MTKLEHVKVEGYYNTWYQIDDLTHADKTYLLLENEKWGDETSALVVIATEKRTAKNEIPKEYIVCETFDDIETALEDEEIL